MTLIVVRHAEPLVAPEADPRLWPLSTAGGAAASRLRHGLPPTGRWVSSTERKAQETLLYAGQPGIAILTDPRFDEVRRKEPFDNDFRARRRAWVDGLLDDRHAGWESPEQAAERFEFAVRDHSARAEVLVVATHGMVLTAWLVHARQRLAPGEAGSFWEQLRFPDIIRID